MRVAHNIAALTAQKNLHRAQVATMRSVDRLSSGLRITRAADDAAGLGVSESLRADIASLKVATRNANNGIGLMQVAEGAYGTISNLFVRMRELATQSASGTLGDAERALLSVEFEALRDEITRLYKRTEFNGINPLAAPSGGVTLGVQVGLHDGNTIDLFPRWSQDRIHHDVGRGAGGHGGSDPKMVAEFVDCLVRKRRPTASGIDGAWSVAIGEAAELARAKGRVVKIADVLDVKSPLLKK